MRSLWIERLSAACRARDSKYNLFVHAITEKNIVLNRKVLSNIAVAFPQVFDKIYGVITK